MKLVDKGITMEEVRQMSQRMFGGLVKGVVDIEKQIMVLDADMHADEENYLLELGSFQDNLWGINLYPDIPGDDFLEFDSMINVRPRLKNFTRSIENADLQKKIIAIVHKLIIK
ncbi:hypothetical protein HGA88_04225 [Candidatus Roizmanbacteria bacterium]|nr:hypothetical protein [Candidatus Roizmanbacteria bacterium]